MGCVQDSGLLKAYLEPDHAVDWEARETNLVFVVEVVAHCFDSLYVMVKQRDSMGALIDMQALKN